MENNLPGVTNEVIHITLDKSWVGDGKEIKGIIMDEIQITDKEYKYYLKQIFPPIRDKNDFKEQFNDLIVYGIYSFTNENRECYKLKDKDE